jgi:hypothetical protein
VKTNYNEKNRDPYVNVTNTSLYVRNRDMRKIKLTTKPCFCCGEYWKTMYYMKNQHILVDELYNWHISNNLVKVANRGVAAIFVGIFKDKWSRALNGVYGKMLPVKRLESVHAHICNWPIRNLGFSAIGHKGRICEIQVEFTT